MTLERRRTLFIDNFYAGSMRLICNGPPGKFTRHIDENADVITKNRLLERIEAFVLEDTTMRRYLAKDFGYNNTADFFKAYQDRHIMTIYGASQDKLAYTSMCAHGHYSHTHEEISFSTHDPIWHQAVCERVKGIEKDIIIQASHKDLSGLMKARLMTSFLTRALELRDYIKDIGSQCQNADMTQSGFQREVRNEMKHFANDLRIAMPYLLLKEHEYKQFLNLAMPGHDIKSAGISTQTAKELERHFRELYRHENQREFQSRITPFFKG